MRIAVNGVELFFDVYGSGLAARGNELVDKPVIVALHGGPGIDHSQFVPWLTPIADAAQLILVDHRGNGRSSRPPVEMRTLANMADDLEALRVPQHILGPEPLLDLGLQLAIGLGQLARTLGDLQFETLVQSAQFLFGPTQSQQGMRGGQQFGWFDRFDQEPVCPAVQRDRTIACAGQRSRCLQHGDARIGRLDPAADVNTVGVWQHHVEQDKVRRRHATLFDGRVARGGLGDVVALLAENMRLQIAAAVIVVDDKDLGRAVIHALPNTASAPSTLPIASLNAPDARSDLHITCDARTSDAR